MTDVGCCARRLAVPLVLLAVAGCSSSVVLTTEPTAKASPSGLRPVAVAVGTVNGSACFREGLTRYLSAPGGLRLAGAGDSPDLTLSGDLRRIEVHSNRGDKELLVTYYTAFVVTAPLAALVYGFKDWQADAAAEGSLVATDRSGATVWSRDLTVSISENQRTLPEDDALKSTMNGAVCEKLATTLLNALAETLATSSR